LFGVGMFSSKPISLFGVGMFSSEPKTKQRDRF
jgi:hypothetical protein